MSLMPALPESVRRLVEQGRSGSTHPGLLLDKYVRIVPVDPGPRRAWSPPNLSEHVQKPALADVVQSSNRLPDSGPEWKAARASRDRLIACLRQSLPEGHIAGWKCTTSGPLTLYLSRAGALENAGICLHRTHGFVHLPGTGIKGLACAWACERWLPDQGDKAVASSKILRVFGHAPAPHLSKLAKRLGTDFSVSLHDPKYASAGSVVFHDAWPVSWPRLVVDIVNCHHGDYYAGNGDPGDWESPVPINFLAVAPGSEFEFLLTARKSDPAPSSLVDSAPGPTASDDLKLAEMWINGALTEMGFGAKTNSGYGRFALRSGDKARPRQTTARLRTFEAELELVSPGFFAGASQFSGDPDVEEGCDLRPATLRGLLRWWWRTMHAGYVTVDELRRVEGAIWGDTTHGGAVSLDLLTHAGTIRRQSFDKVKDGFRIRQPFADEHALRRSEHMATPGILYLTYGMGEKPRGQRDPRWRLFVDAGARYSVRLTARRVRLDTGKEISADMVLQEGTAALWLLSTFGACGAKSRKGWGSLHLVPKDETAELSLEAARQNAKSLRAAFGLDGAFRLAEATQAAWGPATVSDPSAWNDPAATFSRTVATKQTNVWRAIDEVGRAYREIAGDAFKHNAEKLALGLPRKIDGPQDRPMGHQNAGSWRPSQHLDLSAEVRRQLGIGKVEASNLRYASPIQLSLSRGDDGVYSVTVTAFPAIGLPNRTASHAFLKKFLDGLLKALAAIPAETDQQKSRRTGLAPSSKSEVKPPAVPKDCADLKGKIVRCRILAQTTKSGGPMAEIISRPGIRGAILPTTPATSAEAGAEVDLFVATAQPQFRWPNDPQAKPPKPATPKPRGRR